MDDQIRMVIRKHRLTNGDRYNITADDVESGDH